MELTWIASHRIVYQNHTWTVCISSKHSQISKRIRTNLNFSSEYNGLKMNDCYWQWLRKVNAYCKTARIENRKQHIQTHTIAKTKTDIYFHGYNMIWFGSNDNKMLLTSSHCQFVELSKIRSHQNPIRILLMYPL